MLDEAREAAAGQGKPRFRKRDKVMFYGRKMLRKVKSISAGANKKKKIISKITRKLLMKKEATPTQLQVPLYFFSYLFQCSCCKYSNT